MPYGVIGLYTWKNKRSYDKELTGNLYDELKSSWNSTEDSQFLPYLRPLSSMTEDESEEFANMEIVGYNNYDWLNKHHFDYRGLIEKGLAIAVTEENNPYEN